MSETLYLDTARLGLISPTAQQLQIQFARLASDPQGLLYFHDFLASGFQTEGLSSQTAATGFQHWRGVEGLRDSFRQLVGAPQHAEVVLASRSATLMQLAIQQLTEHCNRVLTVDLLWPPYRRILVDAFRRAGRSLAICPIRHAAIHHDASQQTFADAICRNYAKQECQGLLLPLIDHHGISLPVEQIIRRLRVRGCAPKQVVVDASQALGHIDVNLQSLGCDLLIGGAHKWLGGYQPLGIGVSLRPTKQSDCLPASLDPLLRLTQEQTGAWRSRHGETAAILPLLTAAGALADSPPETIRQRLGVRLANRQQLIELLKKSSWKALRQSEEDHGIVLCRTPGYSHLDDGGALRDALAEHGIVATAYPNGLARFSMPPRRFSKEDVCVLQSAINRYAFDALQRSSPKKGRLSCPTVEWTTVRPAVSTRPTTVKSHGTTRMASSVVSSAT